MCFVFIWEQTATCATYSINWLVFITEMKSVYCAVRTGSLTKAVCASYLKGYNRQSSSRVQNLHLSNEFCTEIKSSNIIKTHARTEICSAGKQSLWNLHWLACFMLKQVDRGREGFHFAIAKRFQAIWGWEERARTACHSKALHNLCRTGSLTILLPPPTLHPPPSLQTMHLAWDRITECHATTSGYINALHTWNMFVLVYTEAANSECHFFLFPNIFMTETLNK